MKATVVDLRYRMKDVLKALARREKITILYHGKAKGIIIPPSGDRNRKISAHPFFGMKKNAGRTVERIVRGLRKARFDAV